MSGFHHPKLDGWQAAVASWSRAPRRLAVTLSGGDLFGIFLPAVALMLWVWATPVSAEDSAVAGSPCHSDPECLSAFLLDPDLPSCERLLRLLLATQPLRTFGASTLGPLVEQAQGSSAFASWAWFMLRAQTVHQRLVGLYTAPPLGCHVGTLPFDLVHVPAERHRAAAWLALPDPDPASACAALDVASAGILVFAQAFERLRADARAILWSVVQGDLPPDRFGHALSFHSAGVALGRDAQVMRSALLSYAVATPPCLSIADGSG